MGEDEIWYEAEDQSVFDDGYTVWKGREHPDKIAVTDTEYTAKAICMHAELVAAIEVALQYMAYGRQLPDHATTTEGAARDAVRQKLRTALNRANNNG